MSKLATRQDCAESVNDGAQYSNVESALIFLEKTSNAIAALVLMIMMVLLTADALGRYVFLQPVIGTMEITEMYLLGAVAFLPLAALQRENGHVSVSTFQARIPERLRGLFGVVNTGLGLVVFATIALKTAQMAFESFSEGRETAGLISLPVWCGWAIIFIGTLVLCLRLSLELWRGVFRRR